MDALNRIYTWYWYYANSQADQKLIESLNSLPLSLTEGQLGEYQMLDQMLLLALKMDTD